VPFIKQANSFGLFSTIPAIHATLGWPGNTVGLEQADVPQNIVSSGDFPYPPPADRPEARAFIDGFKKRFGVLPLSEAANSYAAVKFVAAAFEKAGSFDREKFIDAGEGLTIDHPIGGKITIRAFDHQSTQGAMSEKLAWDEIDQHGRIRRRRACRRDSYLRPRISSEGRCGGGNEPSCRMTAGSCAIRTSVGNRLRAQRKGNQAVVYAIQLAGGMVTAIILVRAAGH